MSVHSGFLCLEVKISRRELQESLGLSKKTSKADISRKIEGLFLNNGIFECISIAFA